MSSGEEVVRGPLLLKAGFTRTVLQVPGIALFPLFFYCRCVFLVHTLSVAVKWRWRRLWEDPCLEIGAVSVQSSPGTGTSPETGHQHKPREAQHKPHQQEVRWRLFLVTPTNLLGVTTKLLHLLISRILG